MPADRSLQHWGPGGDHTVCTLVAGIPSTARLDCGENVCNVRKRVASHPGGQGVVGSNPAVPTEMKP